MPILSYPQIYFHQNKPEVLKKKTPVSTNKKCLKNGPHPRNESQQIYHRQASACWVSPLLRLCWFASLWCSSPVWQYWCYAGPGIASIRRAVPRFFLSAAKQWGVCATVVFLNKVSNHVTPRYCFVGLYLLYFVICCLSIIDDDDDDDEFVLFSRFTVTINLHHFALHSGFVKLRFHHVFVLPTCRLQLSHLFGLGHRIRTAERVQLEIPLFTH